MRIVSHGMPPPGAGVNTGQASASAERVMVSPCANDMSTPGTSHGPYQNMRVARSMRSTARPISGFSSSS